MTDIRKYIRSVPDFPKPGILFYDISTLIANGPAWKQTLDLLEEKVSALQPTKLLGIESRGFLTAAPLGDRLGLGFSMIRKPGKLPGEVIGHDYTLEYGSDRLEIQTDTLEPGDRVVILDDLLATGGTLGGAVQLVQAQRAEVIAAAVLVELPFLGGRVKAGCDVISLASYNS